MFSCNFSCCDFVLPPCIESIMPGKKSYGRARRFMRLRGGQPQQRAPNQRDDDRPGPSTECGSGSDGTSPALSPLTSGATESTAVLLTMDQSSASGSRSVPIHAFYNNCHLLFDLFMFSWKLVAKCAYI